MEKEKYEDNKENEYNYIKNICYNMDNGKLTINDSKNKEYKSDIYGRKIPRFLPNITGQHNRYFNDNNNDNNQNIFRKKKLLNIGISSYISSNNSIENNKYNKDNNKKTISYTPIIRKFEGYSKFPRPKGPPLLNIPDYELKEKSKRKIIDNLSNYFENYSVRNDITRKNENKGLAYLTKTLNEYDIIKQDTKKLQTLIQTNLDDIKLKYQLKKNMFKKDRVVKALNAFNYNISENKDSKTINGRILQEPNEKMKRYYKVINSMMKKNKKRNLINERIKNINLQTTCKKYNIKIITDENNKGFTLGKKIKMNFGYSFEEENNKNNLLDNEENKNEIDNINIKEINEEDNLNKENKEENQDDNIKENREENKEDNKEENNEENKEENNKEDEEEESENKMSKILNEKIKKNELSFISYISENEKKNLNKNDIPIKSIKLINNNAEHENKLLDGYIEPPIEDSKIFQKVKILRLKTQGDLYKENLNLLRKTNKKAFLLQEKKDKYDLELLKKKIRNQTINMNNAMGVKQDHKFKKESTNSE